jgi:hypothetical protein
LDGGQTKLLGLRPVVGNVVEILGIGADLLEQRPLRFDVREILLALIFLLALSQQPVFSPDALHGHVANGQIEFAFQPRRAERR